MNGRGGGQRGNEGYKGIRGGTMGSEGERGGQRGNEGVRGGTRGQMVSEGAGALDWLRWLSIQLARWKSQLSERPSGEREMMLLVLRSLPMLA